MERKRLELIDSIRGLTIISMILFHGCWIASYFGIGLSMDVIFSTPFNIWERTICISFILISGFVFAYGRRHLKRGLLELGIGIAITVGSVLFAYDIRDIFGILWLLGLSTLIMIPLDKLINKRGPVSKWSALLLMILSLLLLLLFWNVSRGYLGFNNLLAYPLPKSMYKGYVMTLLGFMDPTFYSVDYFPLMPWIFIYIIGYCLQIIVKNTFIETRLLTIKIPVLNTIGKYSLQIYLIHPVVWFVIFYLISILN